MCASIVRPLELQSDIYARALDARDARFDGLFFVGITTTRIYCRPVCPARVSYREHRRFFHTAAAAERDGFRPCMRCRPELAPGLALVDAVPRLARAAASRIAAGALNGHSVAELARDLGVSERHLRRVLEREIGASPLDLAQTHRLLLAKQLLADTDLAITHVAYASGFQSLRRFNTVFRERYRMSPSALRGSRSNSTKEKAAGLSSDIPVRLSLSYRSPFAWDALLGFLRRDSVAGIETIDARRYGRTIELDGHRGFVFVEDGDGHVNVALSSSLVPVMMPLLARLRQLFDLDAEPTVIDGHLGQSRLASLVARRPGLRIPGAFDGFDVALRTILRGRVHGGHGTSGNDLAANVALALGQPIATEIESLSLLAPSPARVADAGVARLEALGVPKERAMAAITVARLVADRKLHLSPGSDPIVVRQALTSIEGLDEELAEVIVMRALSWPDALPANDPVLQREAQVYSPRALQALGEEWRPWRTYAALHLWLAAETH